MNMIIKEKGVILFIMIKMDCPKCKKQVAESITYKKKFWCYYKVYTFFCGCCDFEKIKEIKISKESYFNALQVETLKAQNTKILTTDKTYNQNYKQILNPLVN